LDWEHEALQTDLSDWQRKQVSGYWKEGLDRWKKLVADEAIWVRVENRIRQLNEPTLRTSLAREMRAALPTALRQINAKLALAFATSGKKPQSSIHIALLRDSASADGACESDIEVALGPLRRGLDEQIKCAKNHRPDGTTTSLCAAQRLLEFARRTLDLFDHFLIRREVNSELFDEVAVVCNQLQAAHHKATSDNKACIDILNAALASPTPVELRRELKKIVQLSRTI